MATFNPKKSNPNTELKTYEGGEAYKIGPELELYSAVVCSAMSEKYYVSNLENSMRIAELCRAVSPIFVAKLAIYTRTQMNMRSIPIFLLTQLASIHNGDSLVSRAIAKTLLRADEITELLASYQIANGRNRVGDKKLGKLSHQVQLGLEAAFNNFDEYQFAKYDRSNREVTLRDALFLVHPKPKDDKQQAIFDKIASRTLETPYTWETEFTELGKHTFSSPEKRQQAFAYKWIELVRSGRLGYMALLRNLRNIINTNVAEWFVKQIGEMLSDVDAVRKSRQLPFRYLSAYQEISRIKDTEKSVEIIKEALERAVAVSAYNIVGFDENTSVLLACDVSGSMRLPVSRSSIECYDVGLMLAMLMQRRCKNTITGIFGNEWEPVDLPSKNILANCEKLHEIEGRVGYGTYPQTILQWLIEKEIAIDKLMIFTDCQLMPYDGDRLNFLEFWRTYRNMYPDAKLYLFDLQGYGLVPLHVNDDEGVYFISGWSDKVFDVLNALENGKSALDLINGIDL